MSNRDVRETRRTKGTRCRFPLFVALVLLLTSFEAQAAFDRAQAGRAGIVGGSVLGSLLYTPAKIVYAGAGSLVGGAAWLFSGGDRNVSKPILDRAWRGDYYLKPSHLRNPESIAFVGQSDPTFAGQRALPSVSATPPACSTVNPAVIYFASGSATLEPRAEKVLKQARKTLRDCPNLAFEVAAYTDATGNEASNRALANRRAERVHSYLLEHGIGAERLSLHSYGERDLGNETPEGRAQNRRVELVAR